MIRDLEREAYTIELLSDPDVIDEIVAVLMEAERNKKGE